MCSQSGKDDWALRNTSPRTFLGQYSAWDCRSNNRNGRVRAPSSPLKRTNCIMTNGDYLVVRRPCTVCYAHHVLQQQDVSFSVRAFESRVFRITHVIQRASILKFGTMTIICVMG